MTNARTGYALPVDPLNELGDPEVAFKAPAVLTFMRTLIDIIRRQFGKFIDRDTATPYFHLTSPNGTVFFVSVGDDGTLKAENARQRQIAKAQGGA